MKLLCLTTIFLIALLSVGCSGGTSESDRLSDSHKISENVSESERSSIKVEAKKFSGVITPKTVEAVILESKKSSGPINLLIDSAGGDQAAAIRLARELEKRGYNLIIDNKCHSACANILMLAADKVYISKNANVAFHANILGWLGLFHDESEDQFNKHIALGKSYIDLLESRNIDPSLMACIDHKHRRIGDIYFKNEIPTQDMKHSMLIVSKHHLDTLGINYVYFDGDKSNVIKDTAALSDWDFSDCRTRLIVNNWSSVKYFASKYISPEDKRESIIVDMENKN